MTTHGVWSDEICRCAIEGSLRRRRDRAALEAEGDRTSGDWRDGHFRFFTGEAAELGVAFTDDAEILLERFTVIRIVGRSDQ